MGIVEKFCWVCENLFVYEVVRIFFWTCRNFLFAWLWQNLVVVWIWNNFVVVTFWWHIDLIMWWWGIDCEDIYFLGMKIFWLYVLGYGN